ASSMVINQLTNHITEQFRSRFEEALAMPSKEEPRKNPTKRRAVEAKNKNGIQLNDLRFIMPDHPRYGDYAFAATQADWTIKIDTTKAEHVYIAIDPAEALDHLQEMAESYSGIKNEDEKITMAAQLCIYKNMLHDDVSEASASDA